MPVCSPHRAYRSAHGASNTSRPNRLTRRRELKESLACESFVFYGPYPRPAQVHFCRSLPHIHDMFLRSCSGCFLCIFRFEVAWEAAPRFTCHRVMIPMPSTRGWRRRSHAVSVSCCVAEMGSRSVTVRLSPQAAFSARHSSRPRVTD